MTSTFNPFGLRGSRTRGHRPNSGGLNRYRMLNGFATPIYTGDPVKLAIATGTIVLCSGSTDSAVGVFAGCLYNNPNNGDQPTFSPYWPGGTSVTDGSQSMAMVMGAEDYTYIIQADASISVGDIGRVFSVTISAGSNRTGITRTALNAAGRAETAKLLQITDIHDIPGNSFSDAYPIVEVRIFSHFDKLTTAA